MNVKPIVVVLLIGGACVVGLFGCGGNQPAEPTAQDKQAQTATSIKSIEQNPTLTPEQKQQMIQGIRESAAAK
jgi:hypothetical protein